MRNRLVWFVPTFPMYNFLAELQIVAEIGPIVDGLNISQYTFVVIAKRSNAIMVKRHLMFAVIYYCFGTNSIIRLLFICRSMIAKHQVP